MRRYGPAGLSAEQRTEMWNRWQAGFPMREIARALSLDPGSIRGPLLQSGGIRPAQRQRCAISLTLADREAISRGLATGDSGRSISNSLGRAASTVSREIKRHGGRSGYLVQIKPMGRPGMTHCVRSGACWLLTPAYAIWWRVNSGSSGHPNRFLDG